MNVTLKDIAKAAGVTHPTVSRALHNHPRISEATRKHIHALAKEMGYRPDPALTALAAYRKTRQPAHLYGKIAILSHESEKIALRPHIADTVTGIQHRANELGFDPEIFRIQPDAPSQRRLNSILFHRGIRGVIVTTLPWPPTSFEWTKFSVVGIGENAMPLKLNYVSYDHDAAIMETYRQLRTLGYKNIGFANQGESEERNRFLFVAAFLKCRYLDGLAPVPPYLYGKTKGHPSAWVKKYRLDAVIGHYNMTTDLSAAGIKVPDDVGVAGFASFENPSIHPDFATYTIDGARLGATAVDFLQTMMQHNQAGIPSPESQHSILIRGSWRNGTTVRNI